MKKIIDYIKNKIKQYQPYFQKVNVPILASSLTFYLLIIIIPLISLIISILNKIGLINNTLGLTLNFSNQLTIFNSISLLITILLIASKLTNGLSILSDVIYDKIPPRKRLKLKIRSYMLVLLLIVIIIIIIISEIIIVYLFKRFISNNLILLRAISNLLIFISVTIISSIIYKVIIPVKIKIKQTIRVSIIISVIWFIINLIMQSGLIKFKNYQNIYGNLTTLFIFIWWLYLISLTFIYGIVINYYLFIHIDKQTIVNNNNEQARINNEKN